MMALASPSLNDRKRVKVYELKNNDWYDRGTGFCGGHYAGENNEARIYVQSEDEPVRVLLETKITRDDGYQKQQDTLIVWTEASGVDMALSFQEAEGCSQIWEFVNEVQQRLVALHPDDMIDNGSPILLPDPELGNLMDIENIMRAASATAAGREALVRFIMAGDNLYIPKLLPLVEIAEDLEDIEDLHRLCNIMKTLILLNDTAIIEFVVSEQAILGVVGALEYDPDFPSHKANHRQFLADESKFREVVKIENPDIKRKIHLIYRLQYLKDVVLARILDDPTFSVLNSLIFFHQVDIVNHIQSNAAFLHELFQIFSTQPPDEQRRKDAVLFISNCSAVAKTIQPPSRAQLYHNLIQGGLLDVLTYALRHHDTAVRVAGSDVLVALVDHDPIMMRQHIFRAINEKQKPLTDTLIELLLVEVDLGVKAQMADSIKVLLDPNAAASSMDMLGRTNGDFMAKMRGNPNAGAQMESFVEGFYDDAAKRLFKPLKDLEHRESLRDISNQEASLYVHLVEILSFFVRQHQYRSKFYILSENLHVRIAQLLSCPQKHLKLAAVKWFRTCIALKDEYHNRQLISHNIFEHLLGVVYETMPRDNLLNSAALELFEFIRKDNLRQLVIALVENYREKLLGIKYVSIFESIVEKYEAYQRGYDNDDASFSTQGAEATPNNKGGLPINGGGVQRWQGLRDADAEEEAYFNTSDGEDDDATGLPTNKTLPSQTTTPVLPSSPAPTRPLVGYPDDEEDDDVGDVMDGLAASPSTPNSAPQRRGAPDGSSPDIQLAANNDGSPLAGPPSSGDVNAPERPGAGFLLHEKRRRDALDDDDDDDLEKLAVQGGVKRRSSTASVRSQFSASGFGGDGTSTAGVANGGVGGGVSGSGSPNERVGHPTPTPTPTTTTTPTATPTPTTPILRRKGSLRKAERESKEYYAKHDEKLTETMTSQQEDKDNTGASPDIIGLEPKEEDAEKTTPRSAEKDDLKEKTEKNKGGNQKPQQQQQPQPQQKKKAITIGSISLSLGKASPTIATSGHEGGKEGSVDVVEEGKNRKAEDAEEGKGKGEGDGATGEGGDAGGTSGRGGAANGGGGAAAGGP